MEFGPLEILAGIGIMVLSLYYYLTSNFNFWEKKNVQGPKPIPFFGNFKDVILGKTHLALLLKEYYDEFKSEPFIGIYGRSKPTLMLKDPDLIKDVLIKDFHVFNDRGIHVSKNSDSLSQNLVNLEYERWKPLRNKLSPVFTSGKLREMFYLIVDCAEHFDKYLEKITSNNKPIECRELTAKFTTQSIGVCAFGLDTNALDEDSAFRKYGRSIFQNSFMNNVRRLLREFAPSLYELLGPYKHTSGTTFFLNTMKETIEYRKKNNVRRNDFVDLLIDLKEQPEKLKTIEFNHAFLTGQALVFFAAGFETSSTTMSNAMYELALNQNIQNKLRSEIKEELSKNGGKLSYDNIKSMKYLDKVFKETLRKYPPGSTLRRKASEAYTFNGSKLSIPKDTSVLIPVWAIQRDPEHYPDPEVFDPERFSEEIEKTRHPMCYLPFGDGPHNCIGARFAVYQSKIGIISIIKNFKLDICEKTCIPYRIIPRSIVPTPLGGIYLKISKI